MSHALLMSLLVLSPLVGFTINGFCFRGHNAKIAGTIATSAMVISFLSALTLVIQLAGMPVESREIRVDFFTWIHVGALRIPMGFVVDQISAIMILIITGVGSLIHLFSVGYMSHDHTPFKFFAYLNFFVFNMLLLVLGENLLVMFVGWEGVGLCSYLLIGYWFTDGEKAAAGMKAFITNRIGDAGLLLGIFLLFQQFGTLQFATLAANAPTIAEATFGPITLACLFLFVGAMGKSAQIPLYVWLPDAMAGPTPVSALIHAATMVTAGVYMIVRLNALYVVAPTAMFVVALVGALTAVFAATIGLAQNDIKKVLAYSTVSQLGYMFLGVGVGAFGAGMFHLMTHAFFKALMFLGAGSVIHGMHHEQDMTKMGGLSKKMPITYFTFLMGWLAIIGMPPFAGFFSKDEILWQAYASPRGHIIFWIMGVVGAVCTAFYMTRLMALTFWGKSRVSKDVHPHESPPSMLIPLSVLALLSVIGGWIGIPHVISAVLPGHIPNMLEHWLEPRIVKIPSEGAHGSVILEWIFMGISVSLAGLSAWFAFFLYAKPNALLGKLTSSMGGLKTLVENKYYVDEMYFASIINPLIKASRFLWGRVDVNIIDRATYLLSDYVKQCGLGLRQLQNGNLQQYLFYMVIGLVVFLVLV
ncbi:MAG: NADH-quinone oxidoreductase subunit L [Bdellovibrionales bacterium]